jgi:hypothetical protein
MINLWDPHVGLTVPVVLITAFLLGMLHGITPDEHTWPITFSYAVGSYSTRRGMLSGVIFSLAFTFQRAIGSELAYLSLDHWFTSVPNLDYLVYLLVGVVMAIAGWHILHGRHFHLFGSHRLAHRPDEEALSDPRPWMPAVHGFIAGWGFGAFAVIIYTVLAPSMPGALWGWVPGALFGLGTMAMQALAGGLFGWLAAKRGLDAPDIRRVSLLTAGRTLQWGGVLFVVGGLFGLLFPHLADWSWNTGIGVHNLDSVGLPTLLVMITVGGIGLITLWRESRHFPGPRH